MLDNNEKKHEFSEEEEKRMRARSAVRAREREEKQRQAQIKKEKQRTFKMNHYLCPNTLKRIKTTFN